MLEIVELNTQEAVAAIIFLIMGVGMATLVLIFVSVLGGSVYQQTQGTIAGISTNTVNETSEIILAVPALYNTSANIWPDSETLLSYNSTTGAEYGFLTEGTNYTVISYVTGQFNITSLGSKESVHTKIKISYTLGNPDIQSDIQSAIRSSFTSLNTVGGYMPIVVLAVIIFLVLGLVMSMMPGFGGRSVYVSGAL